jgi:hypothetical protein
MPAIPALRRLRQTSHTFKATKQVQGLPGLHSESVSKKKGRQVDKRLLRVQRPHPVRIGCREGAERSAPVEAFW